MDDARYACTSASRKRGISLYIVQTMGSNALENLSAVKIAFIPTTTSIVADK